MMHVYLSVGRRYTPDGPLLDPRTVRTKGEAVTSFGKSGRKEKAASSALPRYRITRVSIGFDADDAESFKRRMEQKGHVVHLHDSIVGEMSQKSGHIEYMLEGE